MEMKPKPQAPYLKELVLKMIAVDKKLKRKDDIVCVTKLPIRSVHTIAPAHTNRHIKELKIEQQASQVAAAQPKNDPLLVRLAGMYIGKLLWDTDIEPCATYKIVDITTRWKSKKGAQ